VYINVPYSVNGTHIYVDAVSHQKSANADVTPDGTFVNRRVAHGVPGVYFHGTLGQNVQHIVL